MMSAQLARDVILTYVPLLPVKPNFIAFHFLWILRSMSASTCLEVNVS
jgi:hypothetical protein